MILHEFPIFLLKYSKNSHWNKDFCHRLPFLVMRHTRKIWLGGHATAFPFEWKSASEKFGREVMPPRFHFQSKSASHAEVTPLHFFFGQKSDFHAIEGEEGRATLGRKRNAMCFQPTKGRSTRAKREKHASDTRETCEYFWLLITQHRHPSPLL